jgi:circadian clock protein KaiC
LRASTEGGLPRIPRIETGVPGLDAVLCGGLFRGGVNLVVGPAGAGKTVLGAQIAFHHAAAGGRIVFLTVLTEPHGRMVDHLRGMAFFDESAVGDAVYFVSGYRELEKDGLPGLLRLIHRSVRDRRASLLVVDGGAVVAAMARTPVELQKFTHEVNAFLAAAECTGIVLSTGDPILAETAMVESLLLLDFRNVATRSLRELRVTKMRGSEVLEGTHRYWIRATGLAVYPRIEALAAYAATEEAPSTDNHRRLRFGVRELDAMLGGGIPSTTGTMLLGAPGSGKTLLGCTFLSGGAENGESGLYFGLFEPPHRLLAKLDAIGLPFRRHLDAGALSIVWQPPVERLLDSLAQRLLDAVERTKATRVVIDGMDAFRQVAADPERLPGFLTALMTQLRRRGATTLFTLETDLFRTDIAVPLQGLSATIDNILFLRYVELGARRRRLLSVVKVRDGRHDGSVRTFEITDGGFVVSPGSESAEKVMAEVARGSGGAAPATAPARKRRPPRSGR